jgi:peptide/nickel transport system permease protein
VTEVSSAIDAPAIDALPAFGGEARAARNLWRLSLSAFIENRLAIIGLGIVVLMVLFCFVGPDIYHTNQVRTNLLEANLAPSAQHLLGTDDVGYDIIGRLMVGGQISLEVGLGAAVLSSIVGTAWGAVAGYVGGFVDSLLMRVVDSMYAIPPILLVLLMATIFAPTTFMFIVVISLISWVTTSRLVRGETLSLRVREYVQAARAMGSSRTRNVLRHIVPNVIGTIIVQTTFQVSDAILLMATLSYLGLGPPPPSTSWGGMLSNGLTYVYDGYWWQIYPAGIAIVVSVIAFSFIGDAARDAFDVRLQRR